MDYVELKSGADIPILGTGTNTFGKEGNQYMGKLNGDFAPVVSAIEIGYRLIDCAVMYRNQKTVGKGIAASGIERERLFLTSKIPPEPDWHAAATEEEIEATVDNTLKDLGTDYLDLFLIHHPSVDDEDNLRIWKALEKEVSKGKIKSLGVSNFSNSQLDYIIENGDIFPTVNQIESHPGNWNDSVIAHCQEKGVVPEAWSPLAGAKGQTLDTLSKIGEKYGKTWSQVLLRYQVQRGVIVIPKSHDPRHQREDFEVFDFELSQKEMTEIASL